MTIFKFKLETVLKVKMRVEELRQKELLEAERLCERAQKQLLLRQEEVKQAIIHYREDIANKVDVYQGVEYDRFLRWSNKQVDLAAIHLEQCQRQVDIARQKLIEASKEKRILEKLKEKAHQEYLVEEQRVENNFLDELGTSRYIRQGND